MAYVDLAELKSVLGIGNIYADSVVQEVADSATNIVDVYLLHNRYGITHHQREGSTAILYTDTGTDVYVGQSVTITGVEGNVNGTKTITEVFPTGFKVTASGQATTHPKIPVIPNGWATFTSSVDYTTVPEVREASMAIAVDIWMQRMGTTGQQGVDFAPQPYKLGRAMLQRVIGLLGPHIDPKGLVG